LPAVVSCCPRLQAANVRREFRAVVKAAGIGGAWTPRELRHTGVSLLSLGGVPIEEIARIAGHATTRTTELVYRQELRPRHHHRRHRPRPPPPPHPRAHTRPATQRLTTSRAANSTAHTPGSTAPHAC